MRWDVGGVTQWSTELVANTWYNFAYDIDFSSGTVGLWTSTGSNELQQVVAPMSASASTNSEDWHIGQLRLPNGGTDADPEDWFWSGIFIESGDITTSIAGPLEGSAPIGSSTAQPVSTVAPSSSVPATSTAASTSSASGATQTQWGQCGGTGYTCVLVRPVTFCFDR